MITAQSLSSTHSPLSTLSSVDQVEAALANIRLYESDLSSQLSNLRQAGDISLQKDCHKIDHDGTQLSNHVLHARSIGRSILTEAADTATRLSSAVTVLDREQANVKATLDVVEQLVELKECVVGLHQAMNTSQDWETAAHFVHKTLTIPASVIDCDFAQQVIPSVDAPDPPRVTLQAASDSLCGLFVREFEKAVREGDNAGVTRYFKLFPRIDRLDIGLDVYARYVCQGITARARQNLSSRPTQANPINSGVFYVNVLTGLFEHIAQIVDHHQRLVETHYGAGKMIQVAERLQSEADIQGGIVVDSWYEETGIERRLTDMKSYSFSFLPQTFVAARIGGGAGPGANLSSGPISRSNSPALQSARSVQPAVDEDSETGNLRELEMLMMQSATMLNRWSLYIHFLASKGKPLDPLDSEESGQSEPAIVNAPDFLFECNLHRKVVSNLVLPFNQMLPFFFRCSIERAFRTDENPTGLSLRLGRSLPSSPPYISTAVDDIMFVLNQVIQRALSTSQPAVVSSVIPAISQVLNLDFIGIIQRRMRNEYYPRAAIQGSLPPEDKMIGFIVQLNNLSLSINYIRQIVWAAMTSSAPDPSTTDEEPESGDTPSSDQQQNQRAHISGVEYLQRIFPLGTDAAVIYRHLISLQSSFSTKANELLSDGLSVLFLQVMKPQIRPIMIETFRNSSYDNPQSTSSSNNNGNGNGNTTNDAFAAAVVKAQFSKGFHSLMRPILRLLDPGSDAGNSGTPTSTGLPWSSSGSSSPPHHISPETGYLDPSSSSSSTTVTPLILSTRILSLTLTCLADLLEKRLWSLSGRITPLGALVLEQEVSTIAEEATREGKNTRYTFRHVFARCTQIATIVSMDPDEWVELVESSMGPAGAVVDDEWVLSASERRQAREMLVNK